MWTCWADASSIAGAGNEPDDLPPMRRIDELCRAFGGDRNGALFVDALGGAFANVYSFTEAAMTNLMELCTNLVERSRTLALASIVED
jgi:hypothetical protein